MHEFEIEEALANSMAQAACAARDVNNHNSDNRALTLSARQAKFLSEIRVPIQVDIGTINISADELIDLLPGNSFAFSFDPLAELDLHIAGEKIACAKFIEKDGELGLEIISVGE